MPKSCATESGRKSGDKSMQKSASSQGIVLSYKRPSTTAEADLKPEGSPSCCITSRAAPTFPVAKDTTHIEDTTPTLTSPELLSRGEVMSPPQHAEKLLYDEDCCTCDLKWHCIPHNTCFIYDSCFCEGSSSFPPVKPPRLSWADFSYNWYCELASYLKLHPHSPLPRFGSEVEYSPLVMPYYRVPPPAD